MHDQESLRSVRNQCVSSASRTCFQLIETLNLNKILSKSLHISPATMPVQGAGCWPGALLVFQV